ncbi:hsdR1 protein [Flavobacterium enshiense DK69]|uniref:Uncharacterized protein n=2 Tax=Flavobacterium TaxID=237 RepID=V6SEX6_9FLAO|nr:hsdR1 protein [Flavobacterium enshiense DK69]KGO96869.1 hypothetical protein Q767_04000 [Flavobacterium enshiense DK69]
MELIITTTVTKCAKSPDFAHFLDEKVYQLKLQLVSEHEDHVVRVERSYGKAKKPEDYIQGFK